MYLLNFNDLKTNIWLYSNINNVIYGIQIFIPDPKYSNIFESQVWMNIQIYSGTKVKNGENRHLKAEI